MKVIYSDQHTGHDPQQFIVRGRMKRSNEQPERATLLLEAARRQGHHIVAPEDYGPGPRAAIHTPQYLRFLETAWERCPFNFSDALLGVMGQRLVRRLCKCKTPYSAKDEDLAKLAAEYCRQTQQEPDEVIARWRSRYGASGKVTLYAARGCTACENTGYKGRQGVYELLLATSEIKAAIQRRLPAEELLRSATRAGMVTFEQDAIEKILQGHLDIHQVLVSCR